MRGRVDGLRALLGRLERLHKILQGCRQVVDGLFLLLDSLDTVRNAIGLRSCSHLSVFAHGYIILLYANANSPLEDSDESC